jgi:glucose-like phosphotransferase system IIB component
MGDKVISTEKQQHIENRKAAKLARKDKFDNSKFGKGWNKFKGVSYTKLQNLARAIVFPIAILPIAGIFLGVGGGLAAAAKTNDWGNGAFQFFTILQSIGNIIFASLGLLFATSIAFGFAKASKGVAAVAGFVAFAAMEVTMSALFLPSTNSAGDAVVLFDPWKLAGDYGIVSVGSNKGMLKSVMGITPTLDLSVLGGILVGWLTALVHNKTYSIRVPRVLAFFGGEKFVPIATFLMGVAMGIVLFFVWPMFLLALYYIGDGLGTAMAGGTEAGGQGGSAGNMVGGMAIAFVFGAFERLLIPAGLHHVFYSPFWYTSAGGQWLKPIIGADGIINSWTTTSGSYTIFFDQMNAVGNTYQISDSAWATLQNLQGGKYFDLYSSQVDQAGWTAGQLHQITYDHFTMEVGTVFSSGRFAFMQYGYPAAAVAIIMLAKKENRARTAGIIGSAAATSFLTGITEPMLFSFLFVAPLLWIFHAGMAGISFALAYALNINVGQGFAAGFIDYCFFGLIPGYGSGIGTTWDAFAGRDGALWIPIIGLLIMTPSYFFGFWAIIKAKDYKTPGRGDEGGDDQALAAVQASLAKGTKNADSAEAQIIKGLGGSANIVDMESKAKEVVVTIKSDKKVNAAFIKTGGVKSPVINETSVVLPADDGQALWDKLDAAMRNTTKQVASSGSDSAGKIGGYDRAFLDLILQGLGGDDNITVLDNCATRLRVTVVDPAKVDDAKLKQARAIAVVKKGNGVQAIYGGEVQNIKVALEKIWKQS